MSLIVGTSDVDVIISTMHALYPAPGAKNIFAPPPTKTANLKLKIHAIARSSKGRTKSVDPGVWEGRDISPPEFGWLK